MNLTYEDYCEYHANKCKQCKGKKRIQYNDVWVCCSCQYNASAKWRFDQIQVYPDELKYKTWKDFTGVGQTNRITAGSFVEAKKKAIEYCFDAADLSVVNDRKQHLVIDKHLRDGQNVVIFGPKASGKSLIATLILKEVVYACAIRGHEYSFAWVKASEIVEAARWDSNAAKTIDYDTLDFLGDVNFLFVDNLDIAPAVGNHRHPPDIMSVNRVFSYRLSMKLPTIVTCSNKIWEFLQNPATTQEIKTQYGEELYGLLMHPKNVMIKLER